MIKDEAIANKFAEELLIEGILVISFTFPIVAKG